MRTHVRRAALEDIAEAPRPAYLQAFLLAAELDRHLTRDLYKSPWIPLRPVRWLPLLAAHAGRHTALARYSPADVQAHPLAEPLAGLRADDLLSELLDRGAGRREMEVAQELTPALRALASGDLHHIARALAPSPPSREEIAELERAELALARTA